MNRVLLFCYLSLAAAWAGQAPMPSITGKSNGEAVRLTLVAPLNHHFNLKAPFGLKPDGKIVSQKESELIFDSPVPAPKVMSLTVYLCDDANTYCEKKQLSLNWDPVKKELSGPSVSSITPSALQKVKPKPETLLKDKRDENGFYDNQPESALRDAMQTKRPLLIDFYGVWCPPCNQLDSDVFSNLEFRKATLSFVKLKLDADAKVSWELKSKYKIGGYPTLVFATSEGEEISRVVGYRTWSQLKIEIKNAWESRDIKLSVLKTQADQGNTASAARLGLIFLDRGELEQAIQYLAKVPYYREKWYEAKINLVEKENRLSDLISILKEANLEFPKSTNTVYRKIKLAEAYLSNHQIEERTQELQEAIKLASRQLQSPSQEITNPEITPADLRITIAETYETLGDAENSRKAYSSAAETYKKSAGGDRDRGYNHEYAYSLWKSGKPKEALKLYRQLQRFYPNDFTFYFREAEMHLALKEFEDAQRLAQMAFDKSYGDNRLRVTHILASSMLKQNKKDEAKMLVKQVLESSDIPQDQTIRTHRYVKKLKDLL